MYKCFETIPTDVRQRAFDRIVIESKRTFGRVGMTARAPLCVVLLPGTTKEGLYTTRNCCPWGAINYTLAEDNPVLLERAEGSPLVVRLPDSGKIEAEILSWIGLTTDIASAQRFIERNDGKGFSSFADLADAMGVEYNPS